jgi:membrane protein YdbS with pleckstrin-like domain
MVCPQCGVETAAEAVYCHRCGTRLDASAAPSAPKANPESTGSEKFQAAAQERRNGPDEPEQELWKGSYSSRAMIGLWILGGVATLALLAAGIALHLAKTGWIAILATMLVLWLWLLVVYTRRRLGVRYRLTSQRFFHESGILRHVIDRVEIIDVDDVTCTQGPVERMLGIGTVRISSSDRSHPELVVRGIEDVNRVSGLIDDARRRERIRRGLHIEQV